MRSILFASLLLSIPGMAMAEDTATAAAVTTDAAVKAADLKTRMVVWDKNGSRVGPIISVGAKADGAVDFVTVIQGEKSVRVPGSTLSLAEGKLVTSLARREIGR
ncbi:hypothetical protein [Sphingomonas colocasiae]|uniref:PRC-barrel domain-containing protein n=1 Tax=Sphingomonas colocasiae TaxID=1848973 RepID=A0ABS7PWG7_9SPHN|nr:hypothetical protein [Sphingomonas colocasiae]MBY8824324.1 hypothetical protein [Sphingomonas colocasiae]